MHNILQTAESLGEIVIPSVDCFEDDADDGAVTSNEIPTTVDLLAQTTASNIPAFSLRGPQSALLSLPVVAQDSALMATKVLLHPGVRPRERVAFFVLGAVFDLVCASLTALAERRIAKPDSSISLVESLALEIVAVVADSEFKVLMNQYFYRVMIAKAGIRAKLCAQIFLNK